MTNTGVELTDLYKRYPMKEKQQEHTTPTFTHQSSAGKGIAVAPPSYAMDQHTLILQRKPKKDDEELKKKKPIQAKLKMGKAGDKYERQADSIADQVVRFSKPNPTSGQEERKTFNTKPLADKITPLQSDHASSEVSPDFESRLHAAKGGGQPMPQPTLSFMEQAFGTDLSDVRIHTNDQAITLNEKIGAKAFTLGSDIYFNQGQFQPETTTGKWLLGHELGHVMQQNERFKQLQAGAVAGGIAKVLSVLGSAASISSFLSPSGGIAVENLDWSSLGSLPGDVVNDWQTQGQIFGDKPVDFFAGGTKYRGGYRIPIINEERTFHENLNLVLEVWYHVTHPAVGQPFTFNMGIHLSDDSTASPKDEGCIKKEKIIATNYIFSTPRRNIQITTFTVHYNIRVDEVWTGDWEQKLIISEINPFFMLVPFLRGPEFDKATIKKFISQVSLSERVDK